MEKLLRRTVLTRNQYVTKRRRENEKELRTVWREYQRMKDLQNKAMEQLVKRERQSRREDWMLGPLAPKRDAGEQKETYGAVGPVMAQPVKLPKREVRVPRGRGYDAAGKEDRRLPGFEDGEWRGVGLEGNLAQGDRVVLVRGGSDVGKIGEVIRIESSAAQVFVKGIKRVDLKVPPQSLSETAGRKIYAQELPIPISHVRLITTLPDSRTGVLKDVVVRQVSGGPPYTQRSEGSNLPRHTRYFEDADGVKKEIPWPAEDPDRFYTQSCDTTRDLVEEVTYYPVLHTEAPLAEGVIDELRPPHARSRRDWDDRDFMRRKILQDVRSEWFHQRSQILSQPFWTKEYMLKMREREQSSSAVENIQGN